MGTYLVEHEAWNFPSRLTKNKKAERQGGKVRFGQGGENILPVSLSSLFSSLLLFLKIKRGK